MSSVSINTRPTKIRWLVLALASLTSMMLYLHRYTWAVIRPELAREYGFTNTELERIFTFFNFTYATGQIPSGIIADFFGARFFLSSIMFGWSLSLILFAVAGSYFAFCASRLLFGAVQAGAYPSLSNVSRNWFPPSSRTTMQGFVASFAGRAGGALAPIIMATVLMSHFGFDWKTALIIMAMGGIVLALAFVVLYRNKPEIDGRVNQAERDLFLEDTLSSKSKRRVLSFKQAIKNRGLSIMVFAQVANAGADIVYTIILGSYFLSKEISLGEMGIYASFPLFGGAIGGFFGGFLNDYIIRKTGSRKWGRRIVGFTGKIVAALIVIPTISQNNPLAISLGLGVVKFFSDWSQPTVWGTCTDIGRQYSATVFSIVNTAGNVGAILIPWFVMGPLLDHYTTIELVDGVSKPDTNYYPMFVMVAILYVVTALCWLTIDSTKPIDPDDKPLEI
jgi:MFS transporter, ACS family, glucarate transporter